MSVTESRFSFVFLNLLFYVAASSWLCELDNVGQYVHSEHYETFLTDACSRTLHTGACDIMLCRLPLTVRVKTDMHSYLLDCL